MSYALLRGVEPLERVNLLLSLTRMSSESVTDAIRDHLVGGMDAKVAAAANGIKQQDFSRALIRLNEIHKTVEMIKEIDWSHIRTTTN